MKVRFKTTARGPNTATNWNAGDVRDIPLEAARSLVKAGYAEAAEPWPTDKPESKPEPKPEPEEEKAVDPAPEEAERAVSRGRKKRG